MSRDLLTTLNVSTTESRPATRTTQTSAAGARPVASELATNLLERIERGWSGSRPESQSLWQLAGE